jgi:hypothetical protein
MTIQQERRGTWRVALFGLVLAAVVGLTASPAMAAGNSGSSSASSVQLADICNYWTTSEGFSFNGYWLSGFEYAGHYDGLTAVPSTTRSTSAGSEAQCLLVRDGYNPGPIDGIFGSQSRAATRAFQSDMNDHDSAGLSVDGLPGPQTWKWLRWDSHL